MLGLSLPFALGVAAVGLLAADTAAQNPASLVLLALPSVLLIAAYRAYAKAREQQNNLRLLHEITSLLYNSDDAPTALTDFLTAVRGAFRADDAELVLFGEDEDAVPTLSRSRDGEKPVALQLLERREDADRLVTWADRDRRAHHPHRCRAGSPSSTATPRRHALKDAMVSVLITEGRVQGLLFVSGRLGDVGHVRRQRPRAARDLRPARRDLAGPRPARDRPPPSHRAPGGTASRGDARPADRAAEPDAVPRPHRERPATWPGATASGPRSSTSTSTASSRSTTPTATRPATCC